MSKSPYVSPNLGPTTPWANQTSTGMFRPPETLGLHSTAHEQPAAEESARPKGSPSFTVSAVDPKPDSSAGKDAEAWRPKPSPMLHATAQPFYPSNANSPDHGFLPPPPPFRAATSGMTLPPPGTHSLDEVMRALAYSVHREDDQYAALKESNRVLESEIQRMQIERQTQMQEADQIDMFIEALTELNRDQLMFLEQQGYTESA